MRRLGETRHHHQLEKQRCTGKRRRSFALSFTRLVVALTGRDAQLPMPSYETYHVIRKENDWNACDHAGTALDHHGTASAENLLFLANDDLSNLKTARERHCREADMLLNKLLPDDSNMRALTMSPALFPETDRFRAHQTHRKRRSLGKCVRRRDRGPGAVAKAVQSASGCSTQVTCST